MGYRQLNDELMYQIGIKPYISLDYSFYSLTPSKIDEKLATKLVEFYKKKLKRIQRHMIKLSLKLFIQTLILTLKTEQKKLLDNGFSKEERQQILESLKELTVTNIKNHKQISESDNEDIKHLEKTRKHIVENDMESEDVNKIVEDILELLEDIRIYGTPQFTRQARMAFIARAFCSSLVDSGWFTKNEIDQFMKSIANCILLSLNRIIRKFSVGKMSRNEF